MSDASAATNVCVGSGSTDLCPADWPVAADLAAAEPLASSSELTNIYVTSGEYSSAGGVSFGIKQIKLIGVGPTRPIITIDESNPAGTSLLTTLGAQSIENLQFSIPASTGFIGIRAAISAPKISNVLIEGPDADASTGIHVSESHPTVVNSAINLGSDDSTGVYVDGSTSATIDDLIVTHASNAVKLQGALNFKIRRMRSNAINGVVANSSSGTVSSSIIMPSTVGGENAEGGGVSASSTSGEVNDVHVDNCTLIGAGPGTTGVAATATADTTAQSVEVNSSILSGFGASAGATNVSGGNATVNLAYSRYTTGVFGSTTVASTSQPSNGAFGFVNPAGGNYNLTLGSPLVDAGDPSGLTSEDSATDASNKPRVVSRGAGLIRDIGAYEVQNTAPVPKIKVVTAVPSTTSSTTFSAAGSTDAEGDALTFDWKFDGAPGVSGVTTQKLFILDGPHSVQLTVTDKTGAASQTSAQFNVERGFLPLKIRSQNARLTRKGTFKITLSCPAQAVSSCSGRLLFQTTKKVNAKNYTKRPAWVAAKRTYLRAARYVFSVAPGTTKKIEVRTYSTFQNVLGVHKKFKIQSRLVFGTTTNANLTANRATFTVSAPKSKKK